MRSSYYAPISKLGEWLQCAFVGFIVGFFITLAAGIWAGAYAGMQDVQIKAVKAGVAEWVAQPDGSTIFKFKEIAK